MSINVYSLGSGSKGNCVVVGDGKTNIMIDAGLGVRSVSKGLAEIGLQLEDISGVLLTHEHNDHVRSLAEIAEYLPVYSHRDTFSAVKEFMHVREEALNEVDDKAFTVGDFEITPFNVSHDAAHPLGFKLDNGTESVGYVTDTGYISKGVMKVVQGCNIAVVESNHDKELLLRGGYPERLKRRILSDKGHLCNDETALTVCDLAENGAKRIMLAHVSENNNLGELAYWTTVKKLLGMGADVGEITVRVALQRETVII